MPDRLALLIVAAALLGACGASGAQSPAATSPPPQAETVAPVLTEEAATAAPEATPGPAVTSVPTAEPDQPPATAETAEAAPTTEAAMEPPPAATAAPPAAFPPRIGLSPVAQGFDNPLHLAHAGDGGGRLFVVEKVGRIIALRNGQPAEAPFLDITDRVGSQANEQGLLSVAFHPRYAENGLLFVNYTDRAGDTVISRFSASGDAVDPASEVVLLQINQPYPNHNGGLIMFGPDGYLYVGMGDGGSGGDPQGYGQNPEALLGKLLRIDVDGGEPYAIPQDNPGAAGGALRPEIWALGLRNPWRFSFDRATGDLFIADVGQNATEEINYTPAGTPGGVNYGWNVLEGSGCFRGSSCDPAAFAGPVDEYGHDLGQSVTGGFVYRGAEFPALQGVYLFGDFTSGRIWGLRQAEGGWERAELLDTDLYISSFGEDEAGELYLTSMYDGAVYRVVVE